MTTAISSLLRLALCCAALLVGAAAGAQAQVAVMVNGEPITNFDIEQRSKLTVLSTHKTPTRQQVIDDLIDEKVKIREGKRFGVDPSVTDVDSSYSGMSTRMRMTPEQLTKQLETAGVRPDTLKARMKADMVWTSLVRGRFKDSLLVGEKDVQSAIEVKGGDDKQTAESFEYQMRPVVLIVARGSESNAMDARRKEAEALRNRIQTCEEANEIFKTMQNSAIRDSITKTSADIPPALREVLDKTPIGHLTAPEVTKQGIEMVALCGRKPTTADTPKKREIREKIYAEKYEAKSKSYLREVRKAAMIEYR